MNSADKFLPPEAKPPGTIAVAGEIRNALKNPGVRYKVPLSELVSKVVSSSPDEYNRIKELVKRDFELEDQLFDALRADDWEKALNDEANFQFSSKHRPLVEAVLNGVDTELRKEAKAKTPSSQKSVDVTITDKGFKVKDNGEGMDLDTVLVKLLVPKLTGNMVNESDVIGRFGVGFYSILGYLKGKNDNVVIRTTNGEEGYRISISRYFGEDNTTEGKLQVVISPLAENRAGDIQQGTEIEVNTATFDRVGAEHYLSDTLRFKSEAAINVNGRKINDISSFSVSRKSLPEVYGEKERAVRMIESTETTDTASTVVLSVGGVRVETFDIAGEKLPKVLVLDLPSNIPLPKSRDKIEVNSQTVEGVSAIIDTVMEQPDYARCADIITAIAPVISRLQSRNPSAAREQNMEVKLMGKIAQWKDHLPEGHFLIPASPEVARLDLPGAIPIDARYIPGKMEIPNVSTDPSFESDSVKLYWVPFKENAQVLAVAYGAVFVNERYKTSDPSRLGMLNALMETHDLAAEKDSLRINGKFKLGKTEGEREVVKISPQAQAEIPSDMTQFLNRLEPKIEGKPKHVSVQVKNKKTIPIPQDEYQAMVVKETEWIMMPERKGITALLDRANPKRVEAVRDQNERLRQEITARIPTTREIWVDETEDRIVGQEFLPDSGEHLQQLLIRHHVAYSVSRYVTESKFSFSNKFKISDDPHFWQEVLTDDFYGMLPSLISTDDATVIDRVLRILPDEIRNMVITNLGGENKLQEFKSSSYGFGRTVILGDLMSVYQKNSFEGDAKRKFSQAVIAMSFSEDTKRMAGVYNDIQFLSSLTSEGEFREFASEIFAYSRPLEHFVDPSCHSTDRGILKMQLGSVIDLETTEERLEYMHWYLRNSKNLEELYHHSGLINDWVLTKDGEPYKDHEHIPGNISFRFSSGNYAAVLKVLYTAGIDSEESWKYLRDNLSLIRELAYDKDIRDLIYKRGGTTETVYVSPALRYLTYGPINRGNVEAILGKVRMHGVADSPQGFNYMGKALAYAHLPEETFRQYNELLWRISTERDFAIERLIEGSSVYHASDKKLVTEDGWSPYRNAVDDPQIIEKRLALLNQLPASFARVYLQLETMLVDEKPGVPFSKYKAAHIEAENKLQVMFTKLAERSQEESGRILIALAKESQKSRDYLLHQIEEYGQVDRVARLWLRFLLGKPEEIPHKPEDKFMDGIENTIYITGSDLVGKYFTSDVLSKVSDIEGLEKINGELTDRKRAKEVGQRRIEHAANYQSTEGYVWLRELVQNAFNATRSQSEGRVVNINNFVAGSDFVIEVNDPVGMTLNKVVNALLVPQKSEWESKEVIGFFGQGFFTVFKEADEIRVKTATGNGETNYISIHPIRDYKSKKVIDLDIRMGVKKENFKGTTVSWVKRTDYQEYEAARARAEITTYAGLVPSDSLEIRWNDKKVNTDPQRLVTVTSPLGEVSLYQISGENTVTQNGLYVREIDYEYTSQIPRAVRDFLLAQGISLDIPSAIRLMDSRADIAKKEDILPQIYPAISEAAIRGAAKLFVDGRVYFDRLPYDFIVNAERYAMKVDEEIRHDTATLAGGGQLSNWETYIKDEEKAIQLIMSIPSLDFEGEKISVYEGILLARDKPEMRAKLPPAFQTSLERATGDVMFYKSIDEINFEKAGYTQVGDFQAENLPSEYDAYRAWQEMYRTFLAPVAREGLDYRGTFYCKPDGSLAHYNLLRRNIGWNIFHIENNIEILGKILQGERVTPAERSTLYEFMFSNGSHEFRHREKGLEEVFTHEKSFFRGQRRILEQMIASADPEVVEASLRGKYTGGYLPPVQLSKYQEAQALSNVV